MVRGEVVKHHRSKQVFLARRTRIPCALGTHVILARPDHHPPLGGIDVRIRHRQKICA